MNLLPANGIAAPLQAQPMSVETLLSQADLLFETLASFDIDARIFALNALREKLHHYSPLKHEPVDFVEWVKAENVVANDYNPNTVAPPEMELLRVSIEADGYTQPIVSTHAHRQYEVVDGFHRSRVGKECPTIQQRCLGYLPVVVIRKEQEEKADRMASTIRHNRARGKHRVEGMSDIVLELKARNWSNERIAKNLGMDEDEILRLCQITGLADLFKDEAFSQAWDIEGIITEEDFDELSEALVEQTPPEELSLWRVANTNDASRVFHPFTEWECYKAGFYATTVKGRSKEECEQAYKAFLADESAFRAALQQVITTWIHSCEHYLTNVAMNRIAWLGQAAACHALSIPSTFRAGFNLLTETEQLAANTIALEYLNNWLLAHGRPEISMDEALSYNRQSDIY